MTELLVRGVGRLLTMADHAEPLDGPVAVVVRGGDVAWLGPEPDLPAGLGDLPELDAEGAAVLPGFVDPHTHLVWAGSRRQDFLDRLAGTPYAEVLVRGGGIHSTVRATRAAEEAELERLAAVRVAAMLGAGTTCVEVKSGYALDRPGELRLLDVAGRLADRTGVRVETTYLGAHAVPPDAARSAYVDEVVATVPEAKAHGAGWCDVFCDRGAFTVEEARRVLTAARDAGLGLRLHADQLANIGASQLAAELGCASADHLDHVDAAGARALAAAGVVGVLLPGCALSLRNGRWDAYRVLHEAGVTVALGTDCNPGTSWCESMPYVVQLACLGYGMGVDTAFRAATRGGAAALRRSDVGRLAPGCRGDLVVLDADHEADVVAHLGAPAVRATVVGGVVAARPGSAPAERAGARQRSGSSQSSSANSASTSM